MKRANMQERLVRKLATLDYRQERLECNQVMLGCMLEKQLCNFDRKDYMLGFVVRN